MTLSEAKKRGNRKWDAANMITVSVRLRKEKAEQFRAAAAASGKSPGEILREAIDRTIEQYTIE